MSTKFCHSSINHLIQIHVDLGKVLTYEASVYLGEQFSPLWFSGERGYGEHVWTNINE